jgi:hypothetical protein
MPVAGWIDMKKPIEHPPIHEFLLRTVLYLPLCFFVWFWAASILMLPVTALTDTVLTTLMPDIVVQVQQDGYRNMIVTDIRPPSRANVDQEEVAGLAFEVNPMIYAFGLPLLASLVLATPMTSGRRVAVILLGGVALIVVPVWGITFEALKTLQILGWPDGVPKLGDIGTVKNSLIALGYQAGYLIFPAITPVALWIVTNRPYIEDLTGRAQRTPEGDTGGHVDGKAGGAE